MRGHPRRALKQELACVRAEESDADRRLAERARVLAVHGRWADVVAEWEQRLEGPGAIKAIEEILNLYQSLKVREPLLRLALRQFDLDPRRLEDVNEVSNAKSLFTWAGQAPRWAAWLRERRRRADHPAAALSLAVAAGDTAATLRHAGEAARRGLWYPGRWPLEPDVPTLTPEQQIALLRDYLRVHPDDAAALRRLYRIRPALLGDREQRRFLEGELEAAAAALSQPLDPFRWDRPLEPYPVARDLLRLYQRAGDREAIARLGRRLLRGEPPFDRQVMIDLVAHRFGVSLDEREAVLSGLAVLLAELRPPADRRDLEAFVAATGSVALRSQLARATGKPPVPAADHRRVRVRTVGVHAGVQLLPCRDDALTLAGDEWVGTSWGLVRYRQTGATLEVTQVPLGGPVVSLCRTPHGLFAGGSALFRIDDADGDEPRPVEVVLRKADGKSLALGAFQLVWWQGWLWAIMEGKPSRYDPVRNVWQTLLPLSLRSTPHRRRLFVHAD